MAFERKTLQIPSITDGIYLDVWFYKPTGNAPYPVIVAGHGMTAVKEAGMSAFGERWATDAGFASLIFDYRFFGNSGGQPRNLLDLDKQLEDFRSVVQWARSQDIFLDTKIVVMGSALGSLNACRIALDDPAIAGVMAHSPMLDGYATVMAAGFNPRLVFWATIDQIRSMLGLSPLFIRAVGKEGQFALLNSPSSYPGFVKMFEHSSVPFTDAPNLVSPRVVFQMMGVRPGLSLKRAKFPVLLVIPQEDDMIPLKVARDIAAQSPKIITVVESPGAHFDVMPGEMGYDVNIEAQIKFLQRIKEVV
ncbi:hypothetical protein GALMADRAFT_139671 [Galerina marginata CBS 339.88]|uniref:Serine aminopeptidase S33 domain-containing protein n=1 Tax=Galerina marginata (strain CBS 339.88) TaxID=685588 RepID=A0A067TCS1_GALM3|nr:hypothetical protein GALMADRAFT_139671 [Galerina marginata CBS 339.88]